MEKGYDFGRIAQELGFLTPKGAWDAYTKAKDWLRVTESLDEVIEHEIAKLDAMAIKLMGLNGEGVARAIEVYVKLAERKAKLLGLDAPEKKLIKGQFDVMARTTEVQPEFVADVLQELDRTNRRALTAYHGESVDTAQADSEASSVPSRATA